MPAKMDKKELINEDPVARAILTEMLQKGPRRFSELEEHIRNEELHSYNPHRQVQYRLEQLQDADIVEQDKEKKYHIANGWQLDIAQRYMSNLLKNLYPPELVTPYHKIVESFCIYGLSNDMISEEDAKEITNAAGYLIHILRIAKLKYLDSALTKKWEEFEEEHTVHNPEKIKPYVHYYASHTAYHKGVNNEITKDDIMDRITYGTKDYKLKRMLGEDSVETVAEAILFFIPVFKNIYPLSVGFAANFLLPNTGIHNPNKRYFKKTLEEMNETDTLLYQYINAPIDSKINKKDKVKSE